jgi:hypothetical protein
MVRWYVSNSHSQSPDTACRKSRSITTAARDKQVFTRVTDATDRNQLVGTGERRLTRNAMRWAAPLKIRYWRSRACDELPKSTHNGRSTFSKAAAGRDLNVVGHPHAVGHEGTALLNAPFGFESATLPRDRILSVHFRVGSALADSSSVIPGRNAPRSALARRARMHC